MIIALLIVIAMLMGNMTVLFNNISIAAQSKVTVEFSADNDGNISLGNDNVTLTYTHPSGREYAFNLVQGETKIAFTKEDRLDLKVKL